MSLAFPPRGTLTTTARGVPGGFCPTGMHSPLGVALCSLEELNQLSPHICISNPSARNLLWLPARVDTENNLESHRLGFQYQFCPICFFSCVILSKLLKLHEAFVSSSVNGDNTVPSNPLCSPRWGLISAFHRWRSSIGRSWQVLELIFEPRSFWLQVYDSC